MINNYGIYNNHKLDNTLLILFSELKENRSEALSSEFELLFNGETLIGYRIKNFIRFVKIKYSGIIFLPARPLIDVINSILDKYHQEKLSYKSSSGYITKRNGKDLMVYVNEGTFMIDGSISKGQYCSYYDLDINEDKSLMVINENIRENVDFFSMEEI